MSLLVETIDYSLQNEKCGKKVPFGGKLIVAMPKHWVVPFG